MSRRHTRAIPKPQPVRPLHAPKSRVSEQIQQAFSLFTRGDSPRAESLCRTILSGDPEHPAALTLLGILMAQSRRPEQAAELLGRAAARLPNDASAHNNYGSALRDLGRHLSALGCIDQAIALKPDYPEAHFNRGVALQDLRRHDEALASFERAIALRPDYCAAWNNRGTLLRAQRRLDEALASYDRAISAGPGHA